MKKESKKKEKKTKKDKKNNKTKKIIIISLVAVLLIGLGIIGGLLIKKQMDFKKPIKTDWGDTYYNYIKDNFDTKIENTTEDLKVDSFKVNFYEVKEVEEPIMVMTYNNDEYNKIFYIEDNEVKYFAPVEKTDIKLLYDIENKEYGYYVHRELKNKEDQKITDSYQNIGKEINNLKTKTQDPNTTYSVERDAKTSVTDVNGNEISIPVFEEKYVEYDLDEKGKELDKNFDEKDLKEMVEHKVDVYKELKKVADKMYKQTEKAIKAVEEKHKQQEEAKQEVAKKAEEEAAKKAAEEAKKGVKVGSYTLKYGRYVWDLAELGSPGQKETYIIKSDGTYTYTDMDGKTETGTYRVGRAQDGQSIESLVERDAIIFKGQYEMSYFPTSDGFRDTDLQHFVYMGAN